ncbi:MAG: pyrrolo-quinoline quinone, partial [Alphaproteobacteria bacterium]|nr:pyrrolo-quinoline quinone [Alphaproteobacteria bacterium]
TLIPPPVVAGGRVFAMDAEGAVSAHDAADIGKVLWRSAGVSQEDEDDTLGGGVAFDAGVVYAVSGRGLVVALDAETGKEKWRSMVGQPLRSAPKVGNGKLYVVTLDNQMLALNVSDGEVQWAQRGIAEAAGIMNAVSPAVAGNLVVAPYSSGQVYVLDAASGKELWSDSLSHGRHTKASSQLSGIGGDPVVDGDVLVAVSSGGMISVQSLGNGQRIWERGIGSLNTPWVTGDWIFLVSSDSAVVCLHKFTGQVRWVTQLQRFEDEEDKKGHITWRGPVLAGGQLLVVSSEGQLALIAPDTGAVTGYRDVPDDIFTPPVVAGGKVYLVDQDAELYTLQ